jgi:hypothetical protein
VRAAAAAGLSYLQHIVAMRAIADGDTLAAPPAADPPGDAARLPAHVPAHVDVLVFTRLGHDRG